MMKAGLSRMKVERRKNDSFEESLAGGTDFQQGNYEHVNMLL